MAASALASSGTASVSGVVWQDLDADGMLDPGEPGLEGAVVHLTEAGPDGEFGTADDLSFDPETTDAQGAYAFGELPAGLYRADVEETSGPPGWFIVSSGDDPLEVTLADGQAYAEADFGLTYRGVVTTSVDPGAVSTLAGDGTDANVDGVGTAASFRRISGVATIGEVAFVGGYSAVRRIDLTTGEVTTLAGHPSSTGCTDSSDPAQVRFWDLIDLDTDGTHLYTLEGTCGRVRRVDPATGATTTIASGVSSPKRLVHGPDGYLYVSSAKSVLKVDPASGTKETFAAFDDYAWGVAADAEHLWVTLTTSPRSIVRIALADGSSTTWLSSSVIGERRLASAGDYLYGTAATSGTSHGYHLVRYEKATGEWTKIAGTSAKGYADGVGTDAWFGSISGIAPDGDSLWITDYDNRRFRKADPADPLPAAQSPLATTTARIAPGQASTFAGDGTDATADGVGAEASFKAMGGVVVVGGHAYVSTSGSIRRVDLETGEVTILAGHPTSTGCTNSADPTQVRLTGASSMTTDGYYLYTIHSCTDNRLRRTSLATGATSTVSPLGGIASVTYAPDGYLYMSRGVGEVHRIDPVNGTNTLFATFDAQAYAITADAEALWVMTWVSSGPAVRTIERVDLATGEVTRLVQGDGSIGRNTLVSAGDYLYGTAVPAQTSTADPAIRRYSKADGSWVTIIGDRTATGYVDAIGSDARFHTIQGLATDGVDLWVSDSGNRRLRRVTQPPFFAPGSFAFGWEGYGAWAGGVNAGLGNYVTSVTDAQVATAGPELAFTRTYNSRDPTPAPWGRAGGTPTR